LKKTSKLNKKNQNSKHFLIFILFLAFSSLISCGGKSNKYDSESLLMNRVEKEKNLLTAPNSPLTQEQKNNNFKPIYFSPNEEFLVKAKLTPINFADSIVILTSKGDIRNMFRFGYIDFEYKNKKYRLEGYSQSYPECSLLFIPFKDKTNGVSSYYAGRYIDYEYSGETELTIDFNYAYNPYCAYNDIYNCPLVPDANVLDIEIKAGESFDNQSKEQH